MGSNLTSDTYGIEIVSPFQGLVRLLVRLPQGGALRLSPRRSALGWFVLAFQAGRTGARVSPRRGRDKSVTGQRQRRPGGRTCGPISPRRGRHRPAQGRAKRR